MPKSMLRALPSAAASCTLERLSISVRIVLASLLFMLPAEHRADRAETAGRLAAPAPPALFLLKVIDGLSE